MTHSHQAGKAARIPGSDGVRARRVGGTLGGAFLGLLSAFAATAVPVASVSPQGEVAEVRQVVVRFAQPVVPAGDPRRPAPFTLACEGATPTGESRWLNDRAWAYDLQAPLPAGVRCTLQAVAGFEGLDGSALEGPGRYTFSTGAPVVLGVEPQPGTRVEEEPHFLLRLNGAVDPASVKASAWCEVEGLGERIPVTLVEGPLREQVLAASGRRADRGQPLLLLGCTRRVAAEARVRLVWGPGIAAAGQPQLVSRRTQRFEWKVRTRFLAEFSCERENAQSACLPLRPITVRFNAPVPRAQALAVRLLPATGAALMPKAEGDDTAEMLSAVRFVAPLPENAKLQLTVPAELRDDSGRPLANAGNFPLAVATAGLPPLAKFGGAPFGILEAGTAAEPALLPLTLRQVQADLAGASTGGQVTLKTLSPATPDLELLRWIGRLQQDHDDQFETRKKPLVAGEPGSRRAELPAWKDSTASATEVIGIPLPERGYHLVEVSSRILGASLLARREPMYARTRALVTNLGVHFKRGRSSSLAWVTSLDRARPVAGARVAVSDCRGKPLWSGITDGNGLARIERGFDPQEDSEGPSSARCLSRDGLFVTARAPAGAPDDLSFVFSSWNRGIEPWRFNLPQAQGTRPDRRAHTVFDRTLLRVGETVSMKHFVRLETERGLALPEADSLPTEVLITHVGSQTEQRLPLAWPRGARSAESRWAIPGNAALGLYEVALVRSEQRLASGSFRVETFRVPLVDARLTGPAGPQVAPAALSFDAQINALGGGPMAAAPLKLSALLRRVPLDFAGLDDFSFEPPGRAADSGEDSESAANDGSQLVADKLPATTDRQGAARIEVKGLPVPKGPSELLAELTFNDPNGEVQTVARRLRLWPSSVVVGLRVPGWAASKGEAGLTAVVLGTDGKPLKDREVSIVGHLHQTLSTRKRIVGGFYAYENKRQSRELGRLCSGRSDAQGRVSCSVALTTAGEVELVAQARDDAGRVSEAASTVWVSGSGEWWFAQDNDDRIDILPEQREVAPGQTARLQVRMPFRQATALVTVEREGVMDSRVLALSGREPVIELPIPQAAGTASSADRSWAPNVVVSVLVLRGRLREAPWWSIFTWGWREPGEWWRAFRYEGREYRAPTALVDLARPSFKLGVAALKVGLADHRLDVQVQADKAQYAMRERVLATVRVSAGGRPLAGAEIAFAAVDEGLLALQPNTSWALLDGVLQARPWGVETATAQGEVIGRRHYGRKTLPPGGGGGRNPTRELFDTLLLWRGTVALDANGQAVVEVPLNDSLTRFRLVAIADAGADRYGTGSTTVQVSQDLQMLSGLPPLAREGDRFEAAFTLRNTTARAMSLKASLAGQADMADGPAALTTAPQSLTLAAGAATEVRWTVTVPPRARRIDWTGTAEEAEAPKGSAPARDRLKVVQAIVPAVPVRVWQASLQALEGTLALPLEAPTDAMPGAGGVSIGLQPRLGGALPGLRRYFERYPYTCLEQKTSRAIGLRDRTAFDRVRDELAGYLDSDGLAAYYPPAAGSPARGSDRLTAYLLAAVHEAGWAWPEAQQEAMLVGLTAFVEGRIERRFMAPRADLDVRKLAALEALSRHGRVQARQLGSLAWTPAAWPTSALLDAWSLYRRVEALPERAARLDELQRLVRSRLVAGGTTLKFSTEAEDDWWWLMDGPDGNAARLILAASGLPAWKDEMPLIVSGTLARQRGGAWRTSTDNLWGVLALEKFSAVYETTPVVGRSSVQWGSASGTHDWAAQPGGTTLALPWPAPAGKPVPLQARHEGAGRPWLTVQTLAAVPLKAPLFAGYRITRTVSAVSRQRPDVWSRGDTLRVRLEVQADADRNWVAVSDPLPAGATVLGNGLGRDSAIATQGEKREGRAWPSYEERTPEVWRATFEWLPRGRQVMEYTVRLNGSGRFGLQPTRVEAMYAPESFGELPNGVLEVQP